MRLLFALGAVVVVGSIGAALYFGERSPIIASGVITLPQTMIQQAQGMRSLYIIVRDAKNPMPMPWGALSVTLNKEPSEQVYRFTLTRDNLRIMNPSQEAPQEIILKARLDVDGLGGGDMPGDIVGVSQPIPFGSNNIDLALQDLIAETAPVAGQ